MADKFFGKCSEATTKNRIFWDQELRSVFTLYNDIPQSALETLTVLNIRQTIVKPVEAALNRFEYGMDVMDTNCQLTRVLNNQDEINKLFAEISNELQNKATPSALYENLFQLSPLAKEKLEKSRYTKVSDALHIMKINQQKFQTLMAGELLALDTEKLELSELIDPLISAVGSAKTLKDIGDALTEFMGIQKTVTERAKLIKSILVKFYSTRTAAGDFVCGIRKTLDAQPELFKELGMWQKGLKAAKKGTKAVPSKLLKLVTRKGRK